MLFNMQYNEQTVSLGQGHKTRFNHLPTFARCPSAAFQARRCWRQLSKTKIFFFACFHIYQNPPNITTAMVYQLIWYLTEPSLTSGANGGQNNRKVAFSPAFQMPYQLWIWVAEDEPLDLLALTLMDDEIAIRYHLTGNPSGHVSSLSASISLPHYYHISTHP